MVYAQSCCLNITLAKKKVLFTATFATRTHVRVFKFLLFFSFKFNDGISIRGSVDLFGVDCRVLQIELKRKFTYDNIYRQQSRKTLASADDER